MIIFNYLKKGLTSTVLSHLVVTIGRHGVGFGVDCVGR